MVTWNREQGLIAVDLEGVVRGTSEPIGEWEEVGRLPGTPPAVGAAGEELLAATHESRVMSSSDGGKTWRDLLERGQRGSASYRSAWTESRSSRARSLEPVLERREGA